MKSREENRRKWRENEDKTEEVKARDAMRIEKGRE